MIGLSKESVIKPVDVWVLSPSKQSSFLYGEGYIECNNQGACVNSKSVQPYECGTERDVQTDTESLLIERALEAKFRAQRLINFRERVCQRVTAQAKQQQLESARSAERLSNKCSRLLQPALQVLTECKVINGQEVERDTAHNLRRSGHAAVAAILKEKAEATSRGCMVFGEIEKVICREGQRRNFLLQSAQQQYPPSEFHDKNHISNNSPRNSQVGDAVPRQQRAAVLAAVRREYMAAERAKVKDEAKRVRRTATPERTVPVKINASRKTFPTATCKSEPKERSKCRRVRSINISSGGVVRVHRHIPTSSTPWRSNPVAFNNHSAPTPLRKEQNRFLDALQIQVGAPALCSCRSRAKNALDSGGRNGPGSVSSRSVNCANNCSLYKQPKKRERLLAAVCDQR